MKFVASILFLLTLSPVFASTTNSFDAYEDASIHFHDGTSIRGLGKITNNFSIKFKTSEDSKPEIWTELMLKGITLHRHLDDIDFLYVKVKNRTSMLLLEVIELGEISIFVDVSSYWIPTGNGFNNTLGIQTMPSHQENTSYRFFLKKENEVEAIESFGIFNFRKKAMEFFKNCTQIVDRLKERKYKRGDIVEMVYYYNDYCAALD